MSFNDFNLSQTNKLFKALNGAGYTTKKYSYPSNVGSEGVGHFIMFMINETNNSVSCSAADTTARTITNADVPDLFSSIVPRKEQSSATGLHSRTQVGTVGRTRRTTDIISLYMPDNITSVYGLEYEQVNMEHATALGAGSLIDQTSNLYKGDFDKFSVKSTELYQSLATGQYAPGSDVARVVASNLNQTVADALSAKFREARNPHMEFLFRGVQLRTFTFDFLFTPTSEEEAVNIYNILKLFKMNAVPEIRDNNVGVFYKYPAEFDILFISNGEENRFLHRISTCALTNIAISYSTAGQNSMHKSISLPDGNGAPPTHTHLSLSFTELEIMSKQRMEEGF